MSSSANPFVVQVQVAGVVRYVAADPVEWRTAFADEVKTWKTEAGARRWLAARPEIVGTVMRRSEAQHLQGVRVRVAK